MNRWANENENQKKKTNSFFRCVYKLLGKLWCYVYNWRKDNFAN